MVLSVFGDESADETKQRVFAVSGLLGTEPEWQQAEVAWTALTGGEEFHATDWEKAGRTDEYKALAQALAASPVVGVVYAVDLVAFSQVYPDTLREAAYLKCFSRVVIDIAHNVARRNEIEPSSQIAKIEYTFDNRREVEFSAARLYDGFARDTGFSAATLFASKLSFESSANPRIQMADMIAREGMKDLDRKVGPVNFPERRSKIALGRSGFLFFALKKADLESERTRNADLEKDGFSEAAYHVWLLQRGAQDTWDNRDKFLKHFERRSH